MRAPSVDQTWKINAGTDGRGVMLIMGTTKDNTR